MWYHISIFQRKINWRSNQQTQGCEILEQTGSYPGIQQYTDQRRRQIEIGISNKQRTFLNQK